jgi:ATP-dependent helicase/DNAse subunit B
MAQDKYSAVWVSHSSMGDFLKCPRAYFLKNVYKDPKSGKKIQVVSPALSLGTAVHEVLENLKNIPTDERIKRDLLADFEVAWKKVSGKKGGFQSAEEEEQAKTRGKAMIERALKHPGPLARKTVRLKEAKNGMPPNFYLSEEDNIILCGMIDWMEYVPADDSIIVIDFKTGKNDESGDSLQLPIYALMLNALQKRKVSGAAYWYLDRSDDLTPMKFPDLAEAREKVLIVARKVKEARSKKIFLCPRGEEGCFACQDFEAVLNGEAEYVGTGGYGHDVYIIPKEEIYGDLAEIL